MKITKTGNPEKVKRIIEERRESLNPELKCQYCDAEFRIQSSDVRNRQLGQYPERTQHFVVCPCCSSEIVITGDELPLYYKKYGNRFNFPIPPEIQFVSTPKAPDPKPDQTWVGDPIDNPTKVICKDEE